MLPASAIRRTGWGTVEDILDQPWDFPCRSIYGNPQSERILACMPGGVLKCEQGEESGAANSPSPRCSGHWEGTMAEVQLHYRPGWLLPSGALQPVSCAKPFSDQPGASPYSTAVNPWIQTSGTFLLPAHFMPYLCNAFALLYLGDSLKQAHIFKKL